MKFSVKNKPVDCLIVGVFKDQPWPDLSQALKKSGDFSGNLGECWVVYKDPATRLLLVGCGKFAPLKERDYKKVILSSLKTLSTLNIATAQNLLPELAVEKRSLAWKTKYAVEIYRAGLYRFDQFKTEKKPKMALKEMIFRGKNLDKAIQQGLAIADGMDFSKNLSNLPSNICTPTYLAKEAEKLSKDFKTLSVKTLNKSQIKKLGMGAFYAVAKGSAQDAKLVSVTYKGTTKNKAPIVFVGKGITFDTGGISLKQPEGMIGMKYDMSGAAVILGIIKAIAELKLPINVVGLLACAENMPSGEASKPEDIVQTLSGQTVEIMNTDAEGRLVLCDALTYAERFKPEIVIDIATLTYAVMVALGQHASALLSNNEKLAKDLLTASDDSQDLVWQLPLWDEYQEQLNSPFADMSNSGGRLAGTITAACFLSRFTKKFKWAHLDVAGTAALMAGTDRYATGRPIPLLVQYLINRCE